MSDLLELKKKFVTEPPISRLELVKPNHHPERSPCCKKKIIASLGDGVLIGSCRGCGKNVLRINPRTGKQEWLHGESPWTERDAPQ